MREANSESPIRVFILFQHRLLRDALSRAFRKQADLLVVGCTRQEDCSLQTVLDSQCHVLLMDFFDARWLPANVSLEAGDFSALKCLLTCMDDSADQFLAAVRGGATAYLLKEASTSDLISAVRGSYRGEVSCPPKLCAILFQTVAQMKRTRQTKERRNKVGLTLRQLKLMRLVANGLTNKQIAEQLHVSEYTVKNHMARILKQLDVENRNEAVELMQACSYEVNPRPQP
jgi:DNA-binding NarL/FixJ family response regulator